MIILPGASASQEIGKSNPGIRIPHFYQSFNIESFTFVHSREMEDNSARS